MISDKFLKQEFLVTILEEEASDIKSLQRSAVGKYGIKSQSGLLMRRLKQQSRAEAYQGGVSIRLPYAKENRFLDIKTAFRKKKKFSSRLYNRIIYGRIYGNLIARIKYGFTDEIVDQLVKNLGELYGESIEL